MATKVYFVFPEYEDAFINPIVQKLKTKTEDYYLRMAQRIDDTNYILSSEKYEGKYDKDNVSAFLYPCTTIPEEYPSIVSLFHQKLKKYDDCSIDKNDKTVILVSPYRKEIRGTIFEAICNDVNSFSNNSYLILYDGEGKLLESDVKFDGNNKVIISLPFEFKKVFDWFCGNRNPQYVYAWNRKHGEFGRMTIPNKGEKVSVLLGAKEDAERLMYKAIAKENHKEQNYEMFAYDPEFDKYMEYKYDNNGSFHSYHLDEEAEKKIPKEIMDKMKKLGIDREGYKEKRINICQ